jgi:hypothetical protein
MLIGESSLIKIAHSRRRIQNQAATEKTRAALVEMAQVWTRLADGYEEQPVTQQPATNPTQRRRQARLRVSCQRDVPGAAELSYPAMWPKSAARAIKYSPRT